MRNFNQPYLAQSITEFWRRWHISLSTWLRDYLYVPLGGNRKGRTRTYANLMITMLLGGLWHGANWTFVIWGGLHGLYLAGHKILMRGRKFEFDMTPRFSFGPILRIVVTFNLVCLTWVFFRAADLSVAVEILTRILTWAPGSPELESLVIGERVAVLLLTLVVVDWIQARRGDHAFLVRWHWVPRAAAYAFIILLTLTIGNLIDEVPFIYFQF